MTTNELWAKLQAWLASLSERERRMVTWGGIGAAVLLFFGAAVLPLYAAAGRGEQRVEQKRQDLEWMRSVAGELRAAGPAQAQGATGQSLIVIVDESARASGLGSALTGTQPSGTGGVRVRLEGAAFDIAVAWLASLERQYGLVIESATVDRGAQSGVVNVSVVVKSPG
jgi:general secretion pathway protein M